MSKDIFIQITGIIGESTDGDHPLWIEVDSFNCSVAAAGGDDESSGACTHTPIEVSKTLDVSSPKLALYACQHRPISSTIIEVCRPSGTGSFKTIPYLRVTLTNSVIIAYSVSGGDGVPSESFSLKYEKIQWHYIHTHHQTGAMIGNVISHWDTAKNTGG